MIATLQSSIKGWIGSYNVEKYQLIASLQLHTVSDKKLLNNVVEATILKVKYKVQDVLIPLITMIPTDIPFEFKRLQFLVRLAFAMTINRSQGESLGFSSLLSVFFFEMNHQQQENQNLSESYCFRIVTLRKFS
ncbi:unnamed protein product [Diabrotica balteata]|uniref:ATP-dependent DNA helicase n=1 Tax=Diabrotica balteata TaxID=107213 RepID=A0A9N9TCH0_DIABA|nr:unnamed protein product [Diabrotica balteata]